MLCAEGHSPRPPRWRIQLFGGLRIEAGERVVTHFETRKIAALLACLALRVHQRHAREVLAERLWPDEDWAATRNRLRHALSSLRRELEPDRSEETLVFADRNEVRLNAASISTDVQEFQAALGQAAKCADAGERIGWLRQAVELYGGELLPGYYEDWLATEREHLAEAYRGALVRLASALAELGDLDAAIETGQRAVAADPLREDARCDLMRYLAASGRGSESLREYRDLERLLREELGAVPSPATRALLEELRGPEPARSPAASAPGGGRPEAPDLEAEGGAVPLGSRFYVSRPADPAFHEAISRRDSIVLVKGPRQVGKTSLLARGLQAAREEGARVVLTDLQKLAPEQLTSASALFRAFGEMMADQLDLDLSLDDAWNPQRGWNVNFERFLRRDLLAACEAPLVWGLDEMDRIFSCPFSSVVFGLFRSWHNERSLNPEGPWGRLTLAIAYATEAHLFITDLNQSPFNVGTRLGLEDFTRGEVAELCRRYAAPLQGEMELDRFYRLLGGHPYLVRRGLHCLAQGSLDLAELESRAAEDEGLFGDHLGRMLRALEQDPSLCEAVRALLKGKPCPSSEAFYRLRSGGVAAGASPAEARLRCGLYRSYLERHLP